MTKTTYNVYFPVSRKNSNLRFRERHYCISLFFYLWKLFYVQKYKPSQNLMVVSSIVYLTCGSLYNFLAKCVLPQIISWPPRFLNSSTILSLKTRCLSLVLIHFFLNFKIIMSSLKTHLFKLFYSVPIFCEKGEVWNSCLGLQTSYIKTAVSLYPTTVGAVTGSIQNYARTKIPSCPLYL